MYDFSCQLLLVYYHLASVYYYYITGFQIRGKCISGCFFKSMNAYLNAAHHGWAAKNIFNSRCSKTAILAFLKPFGKPFKTQLTTDY